MLDAHLHMLPLSCSNHRTVSLLFPLFLTSPIALKSRLLLKKMVKCSIFVTNYLEHAIVLCFTCFFPLLFCLLQLLSSEACAVGADPKPRPLSDLCVPLSLLQLKDEDANFHLELKTKRGVKEEHFKSEVHRAGDGKWTVKHTTLQ